MAGSTLISMAACGSRTTTGRTPIPRCGPGFDASGRMLGKLSFPATLKSADPRIVDFTSGGVLVRREDDDGAAHLTTYPLVPVKGGRP